MSPSLKHFFKRPDGGDVFKMGTVFIGSGEHGTEYHVKYTLLNPSLRAKVVQLKGPEGGVITVDPNADAFLSMEPKGRGKER